MPVELYTGLILAWLYTGNAVVVKAHQEEVDFHLKFVLHIPSLPRPNCKMEACSRLGTDKNTHWLCLTSYLMHTHTHVHTHTCTHQYGGLSETLTSLERPQWRLVLRYHGPCPSNGAAPDSLVLIAYIWLVLDWHLSVAVHEVFITSSLVHMQMRQPLTVFTLYCRRWAWPCSVSNGCGVINSLLLSLTLTIFSLGSRMPPFILYIVLVKRLKDYTLAITTNSTWYIYRRSGNFHIR